MQRPQKAQECPAALGFCWSCHSELFPAVPREVLDRSSRLASDGLGEELLAEVAWRPFNELDPADLG